MESNATPTTAISADTTTQAKSAVELPRVTIKYCTQCKWLLRAAYYAQELLSTFSTQIGEVALKPATGGIFRVSVVHTTDAQGSTNPNPNPTTETLLWDRKTEGGFPETKQLKSLVRNIIDPTRDLGHIDRSLNNNNSGGGGKSKRDDDRNNNNSPSSATAAAADDDDQNKASSGSEPGVVVRAPTSSSSASRGGEAGQMQGARDEKCEDCA